jgi:outer membrane protein OmpA-like peptidoglycan-associated protein
VARLLTLMFLAPILALSGSGPALARSIGYIVHFPHNSSRLEPEALTTLVCAAEALGEFKIAIHAGADRSGATHYNLELSQRRGLAVKAALVRWGLRPEHVEVESFGEARPLVETPDGVQELRNRYASLKVLERAGPNGRQNATAPRCPPRKPDPFD